MKIAPEVLMAFVAAAAIIHPTEASHVRRSLSQGNPGNAAAAPGQQERAGNPVTTGERVAGNPEAPGQAGAGNSAEAPGQYNRAHTYEQGNFPYPAGQNKDSSSAQGCDGIPGAGPCEEHKYATAYQQGGGTGTPPSASGQGCAGTIGAGPCQEHEYTHSFQQGGGTGATPASQNSNRFHSQFGREWEFGEENGGWGPKFQWKEFQTKLSCNAENQNELCHHPRLSAKNKQGHWVKRTLYGPIDGKPESRFVCLDPESEALQGCDECGCNGECPTACTCPCIDAEGLQGVRILIRAPIMTSEGPATAFERCVEAQYSAAVVADHRHASCVTLCD